MSKILFRSRFVLHFCCKFNLTPIFFFSKIIYCNLTSVYMYNQITENHFAEVEHSQFHVQSCSDLRKQFPSDCSCGCLRCAHVARVHLSCLVQFSNLRARITASAPWLGRTAGLGRRIRRGNQSRISSTKKKQRKSPAVAR